jgi:transposase-like protein
MYRLIQLRPSSGQTVKEFCAQVGLSEGMFYYWQQRLRDGNAHRVKQEAAGFVVLETAPHPVPRPERELFAEYKGIRFYQEPSVGWLKQLIG